MKNNHDFNGTTQSKLKKVVHAKYIRYTEETNALDYLEKACSYMFSIENNPLNWKWAIISLHGSLYGFAISTLQGTNYETVTYTNKKGVRKLISFDEAIKGCQNKDRMTWTVMSKPLALTKEQQDSIRRLSQEFRNNFEHYMPMSWSIEIHGFPRIAIDILDTIRFLALDTGNYTHLNISQQKRIKSLIYQAKKSLTKSKLYQESVLAHKLYKQKHKT